MTQNVLLSIPQSEAAFISSLALKMGWQVRLKEVMLDNFINLCPNDVDLSDDDIMQEVRAVRYGE